MSLDTLYTITDLAFGEGNFEATLNIDPEHDVFRGHFPGQAIMPGVCLISIVKKIAEAIAGREMQLKQATNIKFLNIIDPFEHKGLRVKGSYLADKKKEMNISASILDTETVFFKFKGVFIIFVSDNKKN